MLKKGIFLLTRKNQYKFITETAQGRRPVKIVWRIWVMIITSVIWRQLERIRDIRSWCRWPGFGLTYRAYGSQMKTGRHIFWPWTDTFEAHMYNRQKLTTMYMKSDRRIWTVLKCSQDKQKNPTKIYLIALIIVYKDENQSNT